MPTTQTDSRQNQEYEEIIKREKKTKEICAQLNHFTDLKPALITIISEIKDLVNCEAISVRLRDKDDYPYYVYNGFPESFIHKENFLCSKDRNGNKIPLSDQSGFKLDCMCGNVIRGRFDASLPFFSSKGSFWSNHTTALLANTSEKDRQSRTRNYCNSCGYESVALIPIKSGKNRIGLIQVNDMRTGMFSEYFIEHLEMIGEQIGLAVENAMSFEKIKEQKLELEEAYSRLEQLQEELIESEKMACLGNLVAGIAHEINTPVGIGITGISSLLEKNKTLAAAFKTNQMRDRDFEDYIRFSDQSAQLVLKNLNRTADLVQTFKRIAVDQSLDDLKTIHLKDYIMEIINSLGPRLKERNIHTQILCDHDLKMRCYPGALAQILVNLIMNSIIHGFNGASDGHILIAAERKDGRLELEYQDDGIGINQDILPKIFEPFVTTNKQSGSGLGLHIVYNLVKRTFGGTITCKSSVNRGALFDVSIPDNKGEDHDE